MRFQLRFQLPDLIIEDRLLNFRIDGLRSRE